MADEPLLLEFVWLPTFDRSARHLLDNENQRSLELALSENPEVGVLMPRTGGFRKMRWGTGRRGKRGGVRIVYFYSAKRTTIYMVLAYAKSDLDDLSEAQRAELRALARILERDAE